MKLELEKKIETFDKKDIGSLKDLVCQSLVAITEDEKSSQNPDDKIKREALAYAIYNGKDEFKSEEFALIKERCKKALSPIALGPIWRELEAAEPKSDK